MIYFFILFIFGCVQQNIIETDRLEKNYFSEVQGCFILFDMKTNLVVKAIGGEVCKKQLPACSTFKVPLAIMAFDSGVLKDENEVLKWDGVKGLRPETNQDQNAKTWIKDSVVWFSQRLTPKIGKQKLEEYLENFDYGNKDLSGGITKAWLIGPSEAPQALKISAYEQIEFMKKFWKGELPVSKRSLELVKKLMFLQSSDKGFKLSGKTGSNFYDKDHKVHLGWFIGHIQNGDQKYLVVTNISDLKPVETKLYGGARAKALTLEILKDNNLW